MEYVYVLLADGDGMIRSIDTPFNVCVKTEEEAKKFVTEGGVGFTHSYEKLAIFDNKDEAINWKFRGDGRKI